MKMKIKHENGNEYAHKNKFHNIIELQCYNTVLNE